MKSSQWKISTNTIDSQRTQISIIQRLCEIFIWESQSHFTKFLAAFRKILGHFVMFSKCFTKFEIQTFMPPISTKIPSSKWATKFRTNDPFEFIESKLKPKMIADSRFTELPRFEISTKSYGSQNSLLSCKSHHSNFFWLTYIHRKLVSSWRRVLGSHKLTRLTSKKRSIIIQQTIQWSYSVELFRVCQSSSGRVTKTVLKYTHTD